MKFDKKIVFECLNKMIVSSLAAFIVGPIQISASEKQLSPSDIQMLDADKIYEEQKKKEHEMEQQGGKILNDFLEHMTLKQKKDFINVLFSGINKFLQFPDDCPKPNSTEFLTTIEKNVVYDENYEPLAQRLMYRPTSEDYNAIKESIRGYCEKQYTIHKWELNNNHELINAFHRALIKKHVEYFGRTTHESYWNPGPNLEKHYQVNDIILPINDAKLKNDCAICLEPLSNLFNKIETPCEHILHEKCLRQWLNNKKNCPICRQELQGAVTLKRIKNG